jgi:hypothetical protein
VSASEGISFSVLPKSLENRIFLSFKHVFLLKGGH